MSGCLSRMTFEKFLKNFSKDFNVNDFRFITVSDEVCVDKNLQNMILNSPSLLPPSHCTSIYIDKDTVTQEYVDHYKRHLKNKYALSTINALVALSIKGEKVVMMCSKKEKKYKYLEIIAEFIEETYGLKTYTYDELKEAVNTGIEWVKDVAPVIEKIDEIEKLIYYENEGKEEKEKMERRQLKEALKKYSRDELVSLCAENEIRIGVDFDKKDIIQLILEAIEKGKKRGN